ncbi:FecR family protein [Chelativorans sp. AA-79]|uniref:FecR family protein n=1 Tax=Chelativorans sp. AA-79 TaxID=3028735 RepID=UPI0023F8F41D|nr:FecR family protein [Chelativorans sp. AA-79]WEX08517.1 FecR family protein [Chelativorans sp. AA-79]
MDSKTEHELLQEATGWILRLENAHRDSPLFQQFNDWLTSCEEHRKAWERANKTWQVLGAINLAPGQEGSSDVPQRSKPPISPADPTRSARPIVARKLYRRPAAVVAAVAAACILWFTVPAMLLAFRADYRTATGETEVVHMADGSTVELGGASAISTDIDTTQRRVTLLAGSAFFDVTPDAERPFIVDVEGLEVRVLGTAFDIQLSSASTSVALLRGSVEAVAETGNQTSEHLEPGQMLVLDHATDAVTINKMPLEDIGSWREGKIFLVNTTVGEAVELIQRYHDAWVSIPDATLANRRVSGLFDLRDPDRALATLVEPFGGRVRSITPFARVISRL